MWARLETEVELHVVLERRGRPLVAAGEMVVQCRRWPDEAAAGLWAEAWPVPTQILVPFLVGVDDLFGASVLGEATRNLDGLNNALHAKAVLEGGPWAQGTFVEPDAA